MDDHVKDLYIALANDFKAADSKAARTSLSEKLAKYPKNSEMWLLLSVTAQRS